MTDLEMVRHCANALALGKVDMFHTGSSNADGPVQAMGILDDGRAGELGYWHRYNPLIRDAEAMALIKHFSLAIDQRGPFHDMLWLVWPPASRTLRAFNADLNRAIVECVAKMHE